MEAPASAGHMPRDGKAATAGARTGVATRPGLLAELPGGAQGAAAGGGAAPLRAAAPMRCVPTSLATAGLGTASVAPAAGAAKVRGRFGSPGPTRPQHRPGPISSSPNARSPTSSGWATPRATPRSSISVAWRRPREYHATRPSRWHNASATSRPCRLAGRPPRRTPAGPLPSGRRTSAGRRRPCRKRPATLSSALRPGRWLTSSSRTPRRSCWRGGLRQRQRLLALPRALCLQPARHLPRSRSPPGPRLLRARARFRRTHRSFRAQEGRQAFLRDIHETRIGLADFPPLRPLDQLSERCADLTLDREGNI